MMRGHVEMSNIGKGLGGFGGDGAQGADWERGAVQGRQLNEAAFPQVRKPGLFERLVTAIKYQFTRDAMVRSSVLPGADDTEQR